MSRYFWPRRNAAQATLFISGLFSLLAIGNAQAQDNRAIGGDLPVLVVTPLRSPLALERSGSAVTVIDREHLREWGSKSLADVLRGSPGLDITETGGPGSLSYLSLRGAGAGQTLVLVDGMRVGDTASTSGDIDFSAISAHDIERIEVLRGPQSALYGSDAMGGVLNIITQKGKRQPRTVLSAEGGSYGTLSTNLSTSGSTDRLTYAFSIHGFHTDGFSRYGYRIGRITSLLQRPLERDKSDKTGVSGRLSYQITPGLNVELGVRNYAGQFHFDNPGAFLLGARDTRLNKGRQNVILAFARISNIMLDGTLKNGLTVFGNQTDRFSRLQQSCFDAVFNSYDCEVRFKSQRTGVDYQGDIKLGALGNLIIGARHERESASGKEQWIMPVSPVMPTFSGSQTTNSVFALHQLNRGPMSLSLGGRIDSVDGRNVFPTWRATFAYNIPGTGSKIRASAGTGAKAPTLYQRFSIYGTPNLRAEENTSYELGFDQKLWEGRAKFALTVFDTRYRNLIDFNFALNNGLGGYFNVGRAHIQGAEVAASVILVPETWKARAAYSYLHAMDSDKDRPLLRRPKHKGFVSVVYSGFPKMEIEGRVTFVGSRMDIINDFPYSRIKMPAFAKIDARASYKFSDRITFFARVENLTDARYQEIRDYATAGHSFFAGARIVW